MICSNCGFTNEDDAQLCVICGETLTPSTPQPAATEEQLCPECGHKGESWLGLCPKCGVLMTNSTSDQGNTQPHSDLPADISNATLTPESVEPAEEKKSEETGGEESDEAPIHSASEFLDETSALSQEETSMKQVHSTLDTLLSDLLEIEIREKERNDLLGELSELPSSLYSEPEEMPEKRKVLFKIPSISAQTRSMLEWFLMFSLISALFIFGISAGIWVSIQLL